MPNDGRPTTGLFVRQSRFSFILLILSFAALSERCFGQTATLPLKGYCKPGRYMPVGVEGANGPAVLSGEGMIPTELNAAGRTIVPVLPITFSLSSIHLTVAGKQFTDVWPAPRMLPIGQRLVAVTSASLESAAQRLFPGEPVTVVVVDAADLSRGPPLAWDVLDGLLTDSVFIDALDPNLLNGFLSQGLKIGTINTPKTRSSEWERERDLHTLSRPVVGPSGALVIETAYVPVAGWSPGQSSQLRRRVVIVAGILMLLFCGCLLLPRKTSIVAIASLAVSSTLGIGWWNGRLPNLRTISGDIAIPGKVETQIDRWTYSTGRGDVIEIPLNDATWPLISTPARAQSLSLKIRCDVDGRLFIGSHPGDGAIVGSLHRTFAANGHPDISTAERSPLVELVRPFYPDLHALGESNESNLEWGTLHLSR